MGMENAGGGHVLTGKCRGERERAGLDIWIFQLNGRGCPQGAKVPTLLQAGLSPREASYPLPPPYPCHISPQVLEAWENLGEPLRGFVLEQKAWRPRLYNWG